MAVKNLAVVYSDGRLVAAVFGMEMWRQVLVVVHRNNDPKEAAQLRQVYLRRPNTSILSRELA